MVIVLAFMRTNDRQNKLFLLFEHKLSHIDPLKWTDKYKGNWNEGLAKFYFRKKYLDIREGFIDSSKELDMKYPFNGFAKYLPNCFAIIPPF